MIEISFFPSNRASPRLKQFIVLELFFSSVHLQITNHTSRSLTWYVRGKISLYAVISSIPLLLFGFPPTEPLGTIPPSQRQGEQGQEVLREEADVTSISAAVQPGEFLWWSLNYPWFAQW